MVEEALADIHEVDRIARALLEGRPTIRAARFTTNPEPDHRNCRPEDLPYDDRPDRPGHP